MDSRLLEHYEEQLGALHELAAEFARQHPKVAGLLGPQGQDAADPCVERLIESFCFLTARRHVKAEAESLRMMARLLEVAFPDYMAPTPSMSVARIFPAEDNDRLACGVPVARGTTFRSRPPEGETTPCQFRSSQDVMLYPLTIAHARLTSVPAEVASFGCHLPPGRPVRSALHLRLRTTNGARFADLQGLDRLPVYLSGEERVASHLFELLHVASVALVIRDPQLSGTTSRPVAVVTSEPVVHEGLESGQGLLPLTWRNFHGHNLLREYFACPERFFFVTLAGLREGFSRIRACEVEVVVLLDRAADRLASLVDASRFTLFCTPVINLFPGRTNQLEMAPGNDTLVVPSRQAPLDYEVFAVERVHAQTTPTSGSFEFRSLLQTQNEDKGNYGRYFMIRREPRLLSDAGRLNGTRTAYSGTEVFVSLVDQKMAPWREDLRYLGVDAWLTNRDLPLLVPRDGVDDLDGPQDDAIASVGLIHPPSPPQSPWPVHEGPWRLIRQMSFNAQPSEEMNHRDGGQSLRNLLRLFLSNDDAEHHRQVAAVIGMQAEPVTLMLSGNGPLVFGRGTQNVLTVDETGLSGISPYLLGLVLEHFMGRQVSVNSFARTELHSMQRGVLAQWPVRMSRRTSAR